MKIAIIGYSGAGKSTLAKKLGRLYNCEALHLDKVNFLPEWQVRDKEEALKIVAEFMENESWVIDGNYKGLMQNERLTSADEIIFLNFSRLDSLKRAYKRYLSNLNRTRDDMAEGCEEKFDWDFFIWIMRDGRTKEVKMRYNNIIEKYKDKIVIIKNQKELDLYYQGLLESLGNANI